MAVRRFHRQGMHRNACLLMLDQEMIAIAKVPYMEARCLQLHFRSVPTCAFAPLHFPRIAHGQYFGRLFAAGQVVISRSSVDVGD